MTTMRRCDGCGSVVDQNEGSANWLVVGVYDENGDVDKYHSAHMCSWQCLVTLAMDDGDLFPNVAPGAVEA